MSLAHLRETKLARTRAPAGAAVERKPASAATAFCGASHEPVYRTMDEAAASGLELCDSCLMLFRQRQKTR